MSVPSQVVALAQKRSPMAKLAAGLRQCAEAIEEMEGRPASDQPMTAQAVAGALGISPAEVYRQIRLGHLKALHFGTAVRIPVDEFEAFRRRRLR